MPGLTSEAIVIREARARDRPFILAFTQHTFRWGDYLSHTWDDWLRSPGGKLLVAEVRGHPVGNLHVSFLGEREAWFEGMRVHPAYRKLGVAANLDARARALARRSGCRVVRLETGSDNLPAQTALGRFGYRRVLSLREWEARPYKGDPKNIRLARQTDLRVLVNLWENSWMRRATRSMSPLGNPWHWGILTQSRLGAAVKHACVWVTPPGGEPRGFAVLSEEVNTFEVMLVVGRGREARDLLSNFRLLANNRGMDKCYLVFPDILRAAGWARQSRFRPQKGGLLIYEQTP